MSTAFEDAKVFVDQLVGMPDGCLLELSHDDVLKSIRYCQSCPLTSFTKPLSLHNRTARIMVIGDTPDDVLFETESGSVLAGLLRRFGILPQEVYITAMTKCQGSQDTAMCVHHINAEVMTIRPSVVVLLGSTVASAFDSNPALGKWHTVYPGVFGLETYNLMAARHDPSKMAMLHDQFAYIAQNKQNMLHV